MQFSLPILFAVLIVINVAAENSHPKQWALLVAGSNTWDNYRHQADIAHAYQILIERGVPASRIVVLFYDDVAHDPENPTPGKLINKPDGPDVYKGLKIDYKGDDVTPHVFLDVLSGNKKAVEGKGTGRVIESGPHDHVFVNFADHGGPGVLCFPDDDLHAKDLIQTLKQLAKKKKYAKLVFYVEACEAGSNFDQLVPQNTNILVSTASAWDESSFAWYCDYKNYPCLGDLYSIQWMEHLDKGISSKENLFDQYKTVRTQTTKSHVQLYGDYRLGPSESNAFVGKNNNLHLISNDTTSHDSVTESGVSSRDVALHYYKRMSVIGESKAKRAKYSLLAHELEKKREFVDETVNNIIEKVVADNEDVKDEVMHKRRPLTEQVLDGYIRVYRHFSNKCFNLSKNQYILKHFYKFVNLCHLGYEEDAIKAIDSECDDAFPVIINTV